MSVKGKRGWSGAGGDSEWLLEEEIERKRKGTKGKVFTTLRLYLFFSFHLPSLRSPRLCGSMVSVSLAYLGALGGVEGDEGEAGLMGEDGESGDEFEGFHS